MSRRQRALVLLRGAVAITGGMSLARAEAQQAIEVRRSVGTGRRRLARPPSPGGPALRQ
jgi:hypothetical protein